VPFVTRQRSRARGFVCMLECWRLLSLLCNRWFQTLCVPETKRSGDMAFAWRCHSSSTN